jgi:NADH-quinone oxidoreductase subunit G
LPFNTAAELRAKLFAACPHLAMLGQVLPADSTAIERLAAQGGKTDKERFGQAVADFYLTNPIARASEIMARLSALHATNTKKATGTDG